ncbi:MAG: hypothetical protein ACR2OH_06930, partial [Microthrixaceae bacterium]
LTRVQYDQWRGAVVAAWRFSAERRRIDRGEFERHASVFASHEGFGMRPAKPSSLARIGAAE